MKVLYNRDVLKIDLMAYKYSRRLKQNLKSPSMKRAETSKKKKLSIAPSDKNSNVLKRLTKKIQDQVIFQDPVISNFDTHHQNKIKRPVFTPVHTISPRMSRSRTLEKERVSRDQDNMRNSSILELSNSFSSESRYDFRQNTAPLLKSKTEKQCKALKWKEIHSIVSSKRKNHVDLENATKKCRKSSKSQNYIPTGIKLTRLSSSFLVSTPVAQSRREFQHSVIEKHLKSTKPATLENLSFSTPIKENLQAFKQIRREKKNSNISLQSSRPCTRLSTSLSAEVPVTMKENIVEGKKRGKRPKDFKTKGKTTLRDSSEDKTQNPTETETTIDCLRSEQIHQKSVTVTDTKMLPATLTLTNKHSSKKKYCRKRSVRKNCNHPSLSTPDLSLLPIDEISLFAESRMEQATNQPGRSQSAPAGINKKAIDEFQCPIGVKRSLPTKGTLKRKRYILNALKEKNDGYEDDIFANQNLPCAFNFPMADDESDSTISSIATPKFGSMLTPFMKKTPRYKDCISPSELLLARKNAEEYIYRRNKNRGSHGSQKSRNSSGQNSVLQEGDNAPEKKKLEFTEALSKLAEIKKIVTANNEDESDQDDYFSDVSL